jgi:spermidine synthase
MEILTLRSGLRRAKGHTIVAGLGLGWLLERVTQKKSVTKVTLIEISGELLDWVLPRLSLGDVEFEVICGDALELLPEMAADVALVDIWRDYGGNELRTPCPEIGFVWCWGK